jgi:hypothetical protein
MTEKGADFSDIQPRDNTGTLFARPRAIPPTAEGLETGVIWQVTPNNAFRLGQQIFFWLEIQNPGAGGEQDFNYISMLRLKLWWARPNQEFRQVFGGSGAVGDRGTVNVDLRVFGAGAAADPLTDNRRVWVPSPKRLDVTEYGTAPPDLPPPGNSDSLLLDDCWTVNLLDPTTIAAKFGPDQVVSQTKPILYPAIGYALGFTYEVEYANPDGAPVPFIPIGLTWAQGTFGSGRISESIG